MLIFKEIKIMSERTDSLEWVYVVLWIWAFPIMFVLWVSKKLQEDKP